MTLPLAELRDLSVLTGESVMFEVNHVLDLYLFG